MRLSDEAHFQEEIQRRGTSVVVVAFRVHLTRGLSLRSPSPSMVRVENESGEDKPRRSDLSL